MAELAKGAAQFGVLQPLMLLLLVKASRELARFWLAGLKSRHVICGRLLIFGAGTAGAQTAAALVISSAFELLGYVDEDRRKVGRSINGVPVFFVLKVFLA